MQRVTNFTVEANSSKNFENTGAKVQKSKALEVQFVYFQ